MHLLFQIPLILAAIWTGFVTMGLEAQMFGFVHWFGFLAIGCFWALFAMLAVLVD